MPPSLPEAVDVKSHATPDGLDFSPSSGPPRVVPPGFPALRRAPSQRATGHLRISGKDLAFHLQALPSPLPPSLKSAGPRLGSKPKLTGTAIHADQVVCPDDLPENDRHFTIEMMYTNDRRVDMIWERNGPTTTPSSTLLIIGTGMS